MSTKLIAIFPSRQSVLEALDHLAKLNLVEVGKAAAVAKAATGEMVVVNPNEFSLSEGRRAGGSLGALMTAFGVAHFGALILPGIGPILAIGAGAVVGGLLGGFTGQIAGMLLQAGFRSDQIESLAEHLKTNEVALVIELDERDSLPQLRSEFHKMNVPLLENTELEVA